MLYLYFKSAMYFFNCFELGPSIILSSLSISTIPLAPNFCIPSLFTILVSLSLTLSLDRFISVSIIL